MVHKTGKRQGKGQIAMSKIEDKIKELPPELQQEVFDFINFLIERKIKKKRKKLKLEWAGGLKDLGDKYSSVELQHRVLEWWGD